MWPSTLEWTTAGAVTVAKTFCMLPIIGVSSAVSVTKPLVVVTYLDPKVNVVSRFGRGAGYPKSVGSRGCFGFDPTVSQVIDL